MKLCGREECVYQAFQNMLGKMKEDVAEKQSSIYPEQIVVAKIYDLNAAILAEACRRRFEVKKKDCEPCKRFSKKHLNLDTFILLNQLTEDGHIDEKYKREIFKSLIEINPEVEKLIKGAKDRGLV